MAMVLRVGLIILAVLAVLIGALWLFQRRIMYLPTGTAGQPPAGWQTVTVSTGDGLDIEGWHATVDETAPVVVVFPGNAGNRSGRLPLGNALAAEGLNVVLVEYRGYGGNPGSPTEAGLTQDALAYAQWARQAHPNSTILYFGESLGAAVAVRTATGQPPDAVVLRSPFTSAPDVAAVHYPFLPVHRMIWDRWPVRSEIAGVDAPVSVVAGTADGTIPLTQSRAVFDTARTRVTWVAVEGADHNDPDLTHGPQVIETIVSATQ